MWCLHTFQVTEMPTPPLPHLPGPVPHFSSAFPLQTSSDSCGTTRSLRFLSEAGVQTDRAPSGKAGDLTEAFLEPQKRRCTHAVMLSAVTREDLHGLVPGMCGVGQLPLPKLGHAEGRKQWLVPACPVCVRKRAGEAVTLFRPWASPRRSAWSALAPWATSPAQPCAWPGISPRHTDASAGRWRRRRRCCSGTSGLRAQHVLWVYCLSAPRHPSWRCLVG